MPTSHSPELLERKSTGQLKCDKNGIMPTSHSPELLERKSTGQLKCDKNGILSMSYKNENPVTVEDLIKELQKLKPDAIVLIEDHENGNVYELSAVVTGGNSISLRFNDED